MAEVWRAGQKRIAASELTGMQDETRRHRPIISETAQGIESTEGAGEEFAGGSGEDSISFAVRRWYKYEDGTNPTKGVTDPGQKDYDYLEQDTPPYSDTEFGLHAFAFWCALNVIEGAALVTNYVQYCIPGADP